MTNRFIPSLLIPEIFFPVKDKAGFTADIMKQLSEEGFYRAFEIGDVSQVAERKQIADLATENQYEITQWLTFLIDKNGLDVSSTDSKLRKESVKQLTESIYGAAECGASNIAFVTGADPGVKLRKDAMEGLYESVCEICEEAAAYHMNVLVEPLDRDAHKKRIIGPTNEAVGFIHRVEKQYKNIGLAFDTAHAALNGEDIHEALEEAKHETHQIHFSNAVLDKKNHLYGDNHMPLGEPGFLTIDKIASALRKADELGIKKEEGLRVAAEVRGRDADNYLNNERETRKILKNALDIVRDQNVMH
ncbi:sugar phosphate isomerase/epimerase family protein [Oceanobacillus timonensis]|uniref:sugar phosphate isomerase/epimerase family protein n=1 Tax=Oceanobacillus timonensis TaxID=1926285 RepID=UPI0015C458D8|nr:TIM barrel protein [Oceanobacillus timonensis]